MGEKAEAEAAVRTALPRPALVHVSQGILMDRVRWTGWSRYQQGGKKKKGDNTPSATQMHAAAKVSQSW